MQVTRDDKLLSGRIRRAQRLQVALLNLLDRLGLSVIRRWVAVSNQFAVIWTVLKLALQGESWPRTTRSVFVRQLLFTGVDALPVCVRVAVAMGVMVVVQSELWRREIGGAFSVLESMVWTTTVRELGPLVANLIVIGRSGTAMTTELANMSLSGEVEVLDSQGIDPMKYLVMPRILSTAISVYCLGVLIVATIFASGYLMAFLLNVAGGPGPFFSRMSELATLEDGVFFTAKTLVVGLFVGAICTTEGLRVQRSTTETPVVASRSGVFALTAVFVTSALLSLIFYQRVLLIPVGELFRF